MGMEWSIPRPIPFPSKPRYSFHLLHAGYLHSAPSAKAKGPWPGIAKEESMAGWVLFEAALPLGIIAGMLCIAGNAQYFIHKAAHGRPKHIGNDMWDVAMERRDKKLLHTSSSSN